MNIKKLFTITGMCILITATLNIYNLKIAFAQVNNGTDISMNGSSSSSSGSGSGKSGSTPASKQPTKIIKYTTDQIIAFSDIDRIQYVIATKYQESQEAAKSGHYYDMTASAIPYPGYTTATKKTIRIQDVDKNGNITNYLYNNITPALYAQITGGSDHNYSNDFKTLYYQWELSGPLALYHKSMGAGDYTSNSTSWHGTQYETVRVPNDQAAVGNYVGTSQAYQSWNNYSYKTFNYTYYEDWNPYSNKRIILDKGSWSTTPQIVSKGEGLRGNITRTPFDVILQDLGMVKKIETPQTTTDVDVIPILIK